MMHGNQNVLGSSATIDDKERKNSMINGISWDSVAQDACPREEGSTEARKIVQVSWENN